MFGIGCCVRAAAGAWRVLPPVAASIVVVVVAASSRAAAATPPDLFPKAAASYIVVADGRPLWARHPSAPRAPASLAKLLTALVLLEEGWDATAPVTVSRRAASIEGSRLGLRTGESLAAGDALTALLVRSANDACIALAEHAAGSVEAFVIRMNARAHRLGMLDSRFGQPCGLDAPGQRSTARDLLLLAIRAMEQPEIARRVALAGASVRTIAGRVLSMANGNHLLGRVAGTVGVKTGFTREAGKCLIARVRRDGHDVWLVLLDAPDRWWVAAGIVDAAYARLAMEDT